MASVTFSGSDVDPLPSPWAQSRSAGQFKQASNTATPQSGSACGSRYTSSTQDVSEVVIDASVSTPIDGGPSIHTDSSYSGYAFRGDWFGSYLCIIKRIDANVETILSMGGTSGTGGDTERLYRSSGNVVARVNGVDQTSASDSTYTSGNPGLDGAGSAVKFSSWTDASGGGGVTVNLTGSAATSSAGSLGNSHSIPVSGQALSSAQGTIAPNRAVPITGQSVTASQTAPSISSAITLSGSSVTTSSGSVAVAVSVALSGLPASASAGTIVAEISKALTGQAATASQGSLAYSASLALVGAALTIAQGFVSTGNDVIVALTGQSMSSALGSLSPAHANALSGISMSTGIGTISAEHAAALSGQATTLSAGTVAVLRALAILGIPCTVSQGTVTANAGGNVTVSLTGASMTADSGSLGVTVSISLNGMVAALVTGDVYALVPPPEEGPIPYPSVEGYFASPNPAFCVDNPQPGTLVAGENGCIVGRFARADAEGIVWNGRRSALDTLGFVLSVPANRGAMYWSNGAAVLRQGLPITLMSGGDFWCRFSYGASVGAQVYASLVDGGAVSGYASGCEPTRWYVVTPAAPGGLAIISTTSRAH